VFFGVFFQKRVVFKNFRVVFKNISVVFDRKTAIFRKQKWRPFFLIYVKFLHKLPNLCKKSAFFVKIFRCTLFSSVQFRMKNAKINKKMRVFLREKFNVFLYRKSV